ncbi:DUF3316 domain-containing protein [Coprobacter sp.]
MNFRQCRKIISLLLLVLFGKSSILATEQKDSVKIVRPVVASTYFSIGNNQVYDTYLSINRYSGLDMGIGHERMRIAPFGAGRVVMQHIFDAGFSSTQNLPGNGRMITGMFDYSFGLYRMFRLPCRLKLLGGGDLVANVGGIYNLRNSNNPAAAKASLNIGLVGMAIYTWQIRNYPVTFRYYVSIPFAGTFFCPGYGQTYYEMFSLGNTKGIAHFGSFHNQFDMSNLFTVDFPVGRSALRIGYRNRLRSTHQNHLVYKMYTHVFTIGIATEFVTRTQRRKAMSVVSSISAFY